MMIKAYDIETKGDCFINTAHVLWIEQAHEWYAWRIVTIKPCGPVVSADDAQRITDAINGESK